MRLKDFTTRTLVLIAMLFSVAVHSLAYSFGVNNIYYSITSNNTCSVTYPAVSWDDEEDGYWQYYVENSQEYSDAADDYYIIWSYYSGSVSIPSNVTYNGQTYQVTAIGDHAFENCRNLNSVSIPNSVTSIGYNAFRNSSLSTITLPSSLTTIGNGAFECCNSLGALAIPSSVTSIGNNVFRLSNLAVIDINATNLTSIGSDAFKECSKLKTVNLNSIASWLNVSLNNPASSPFYNGADLYVADEEKITISFPVATTLIPAYAFFGCRNITSVTIPAQVNSIGAGAFSNCPALTSITVNSGNSYFCTQDDILYNSNKTTLLFCSKYKTGAVTIPGTVKTIKEYAFMSCNSISSVDIPSSVTSIEDSAFSGCSGALTVNCNIPPGTYSSSPFYNASFTQVTFGENVTSIGTYAFYNTSISSVTIPNTVTSIGSSAFQTYGGRIRTVNVKMSDYSGISTNSILHSYLPSSATWNYYLNDNLITDLNIPGSVTAIGDYAFFNAKGITSITLSSSLTSIGGSAFYGCSGITSLTLPNSLTSIGNSAFYGCSGITSLTLPNSLTSIGNSAFSGCSGITSFTLPASLTSIGSSAFNGCSGTLMVNCNIPNESYSYDKDYIFSGSSFSTVTFGDGVTSIGGCAFYDRSSITSITLPNSLTSIGSSAFSGCSGITSLTLPNSLTSIGGSAFYGCSGIKSLTLPNSLTSIGSSAFSGIIGTIIIECNISDQEYSSYSNKSPFSGSYRKIIIEDNVTSIGSNVFTNYCTPTAFICKATAPPTLGSNNAFGGKKKIYVPYASVDAYKSAWSQLSTSSDYQYFPLLDVMFFEDQTAESYAAELNGKNKASITSVAFYDGELDATLTESVMKNGMNPNCLYYVPASAGMSGDNIITLDSYEAQNVSLTDNYAYNCPIPFHAEEIEYVHNPSVWANGSAGWETICLPFAPDVFQASERGYISPIALGSTGNFWLRKFVGASSDAVYFSSTIDGQMEANTPYLVAFPGSSMGNGHLEGQTITFKGYDADIQVTEQPEVRNNNFIFVGNYDTAADGIEGYALNAAGSMFTRSTNVGNQPFRAYFRNEAGQASNVKLFIDPDNPTDIRSLAAPSDMNISSLGHGGLIIQSNSDREIRVYSIDGRLERTLQLTAGENRIDGLHKGLYIIDNKKIMIR